MNRGLFLCGLLIALFLAGRGDDKAKIVNQITLYSRSDVIHLEGSLGMDSILVGGFTACGVHDTKWGILPGNVAQGFDMNASYLYFSYEAGVISLEDNTYDIGQNSYAEEKVDFLKDFNSQGFVISSQYMQDSKRQAIACTYLICVEKNSDGKRVGHWLPVRPEELRWRYLRVNFDQLENAE